MCMYEPGVKNVQVRNGEGVGEECYCVLYKGLGVIFLRMENDLAFVH